MKKSFFHTFLYGIATHAGIGYLLGGGTLASLLQVIFIGYLNLSQNFFLPLIIFIFCIGYYVSSYVIIFEQEHDPSCIVIDESWGMLIALYGVPCSMEWYCIAFFLFRFFDIVKPFPISAIERLDGAWGVMLDDGLAGAFSCVIIHALLLFQ